MKPEPYLLLLWLSFISFLLSVPNSLADDPVGHGYTVESIDAKDSTGSLVADLRLIQPTSTYGPDVPHLKFKAR